MKKEDLITAAGRVRNIVDSCETFDQIETATRYKNLIFKGAYRLYSNREITRREYDFIVLQISRGF